MHKIECFEPQKSIKKSQHPTRRGSSELWDWVQVVQAPQNCDPLAGRPGVGKAQSLDDWRIGLLENL